MQAHLRPFLDRLVGHSRLSEAEQEAVLGLPQRFVAFEANRVVVPIEARTSQLTVVADGLVARFGMNEEGERQIIALAMPGDAPDLHAVVLPSHTVPLVTLTKSTLIHVPHPALRAIAAQYPAVAEAFWRHCSIDVSITAAWAVNMWRSATRPRLCHLLCELAVRLKAKIRDGGVTFPFPLTQIQLGDAIGVTPIHVNRTLKALRDDDLVHISKRTASIPDWARLVEEGRFADSYLRTDFEPGDRLRIVD